MLEYTLSAVAAILLLVTLKIIPLKINSKILMKVVVISLFNIILSFLLYSLYSLPIAIVALLFLSVFFAVLVAKQDEFYKESYKRKKPKNLRIMEEKLGQTIEQKKIIKPVSNHLDQDSIDNLIKAVTEDVEKEVEIVSDIEMKGTNQDNKEHNNLLSTDFVASTEEVTGLIESEVKSREGFEVTEELQQILSQDQGNLKSEIEEAIQVFLAEDVATEKTELNDDALSEITVDKNDSEDIEVIFEGLTRKLMLEVEEEDRDKENEAELLVYDRGLMDEITNDQQPALEVELKSKVKKNEVQIDFKDSILQKRAKLFEDLEKE